MQGLLGLAALGVAWLVLSIAGRPLIALLAGKSVGARAIARQPEAIHLSRATDDAWRDADAARRLWQPFVESGFQDAGNYKVDEMPGVIVRLLAHPAESLIASVYEHPQAGNWTEVTTRYAKGDTFSVSTLEATGLDDRPGHTMLRMGGASPDRILAIARDRRPRAPMYTVEATNVAAEFERAYAEAMAWRREQGVSQREAVKVALKKAA